MPFQESPYRRHPVTVFLCVGHPKTNTWLCFRANIKTTTCLVYSTTSFNTKSYTPKTNMTCPLERGHFKRKGSSSLKNYQRHLFNQIMYIYICIKDPWLLESFNLSVVAIYIFTQRPFSKNYPFGGPQRKTWVKVCSTVGVSPLRRTSIGHFHGQFLVEVKPCNSESTYTPTTGCFQR